MQRRILQFMNDVVAERGYPPSIREIAEAVGLSSTSSVHAQLATLERKGYIRRAPGKPRHVDIELPSEGAPDPAIEDLSNTERRVLDVLREYVSRRRFSPSQEEIAEVLGLSSTSSVRLALKGLESKGLIQREGGKPRSIRIPYQSPEPSPWPPEALLSQSDTGSSSSVDVPVLDERVAAGAPILSRSRTLQDADYYMTLPRELVGPGETFIVRVQGDSMRDAHILDRDYVAVRPWPMESPPPPHGTIVVALLDEEVTVKRLYHQGSDVRLMPANPAYEPIDARDAVILGTVVSVLRRLRQ
jgi:repressor LexA